MQNEKISVIVPVFNVEQYLDQCIESLVMQTYDDLDIILVDDGSKDSSLELCNKWASKDTRIRVFHKENGGLADARNFGLDKAIGEYVSFVDSDDFVDVNMYSKLLEFFHKFVDVDIVCCSGQRFFKENFFESCFEYYDTNTVLEADVVVKRMLKDEIASHVVKGLYKSFCWKDVRFPLNRLYEDIPVTFLAYAKARKIAFVKEPLYFYRTNSESISNTPKAIKPFHIFLGFQEHYIYSIKHFPDIEQFCLEKTAHYAISTCFHFYSERKKELERPSKITATFLNSHKKELRHNMKDIPKSRRIALKMFYFSKPLFRFFCRLMHIFGLQKRMGFEEK